MRPIDAYALVHSEDADFHQWREQVAEPAWEYFTDGTQLDAPDVLPAGSMLSDSRAALIGFRPYKQSACRRGEDWVWVDDPYSGHRVRIPGDALSEFRAACS